MDHSELTALGALAALQSGATTSEALVEALLARAAAHRDLNAFISQDPERVRAAARAADAARASGGDRGDLHGVPIALKDNIDTVDLPTTGGTPGLRSHRPARNAPVAEALFDAGAILLGKTNLHELAYGVTNNNAAFGAARNPWDRRLIPGGSERRHRRGGGGAARAGGTRERHGRLRPHPGGAVRLRGLPADHRAMLAGRRRARSRARATRWAR